MTLQVTGKGQVDILNPVLLSPRQQIASFDPLVYTQIITEPKSLEHDDITYPCSVGMYV